MTEPPVKRSPGRPPSAPEERKDHNIEGRVTKSEREAYDAAGGTPWLRALLRRFTPAQLKALLHIKPPKV